MQCRYIRGGGIVTKGASGYARYDAMMAYQIDKNLTFQLNVYNLGNKVYYTGVRSPHYANMGAGRSAVASQVHVLIHVLTGAMAVLPALDLAQPGCKPCPKAPQASDASGAFYMHTWRVRIAAHSQSLIRHQNHSL
jgi:hypothetical protein